MAEQDNHDTSKVKILSKQTDPIIVDLLKWLKENLPPETDEEIIFKKVKRVQKAYEFLVDNAFEIFQGEVIKAHQQQLNQHIEDHNNVTGFEDSVTTKLNEMRDYLNLNDEKQMKTKKLEASRAKLDIKKEQYQLINSIRLDGCMDLISRYNHLMSKK